jgi:hypothetical protein
LNVYVPGENGKRDGGEQGEREREQTIQKKKKKMLRGVSTGGE